MDDQFEYLLKGCDDLLKDRKHLFKSYGGSLEEAPGRKFEPVYFQIIPADTFAEMTDKLKTDAPPPKLTQYRIYY